MRTAFLLLACPFLGGCIAFGYPDISRTPTIPIDVPEVHAFRVVSDSEFHGFLICGTFAWGRTIEEIPVTDATVPAEVERSFPYAWEVYPIYGCNRHRSMAVLLYRPGYDLVEVPARNWLLSIATFEAKPIEWKPVPFDRQVAALNRLLGGSDSMLRSDHVDRNVAEFAAGEYERLSRSPDAADDLKKALEGLAADLRSRAAKPASTAP
jgi:hypothetical protein